MIQTILLSLHQILVPIVAITAVFSIPIIAILHHYKQKKREMDERALMIEKGITPPPLGSGKKKHSRSKALQDGLNLLAVGLGLLVGFFIEDAFSLPRAFAIGGAILLFLGIANVMMVIFEPKVNNDDEK
mgnify:CR=1 FL=1